MNTKRHLSPDCQHLRRYWLIIGCRLFESQTVQWYSLTRLTVGGLHLRIVRRSRSICGFRLYVIEVLHFSGVLSGWTRLQSGYGLSPSASGSVKIIKSGIVIPFITLGRFTARLE